MTIYQHKTSFIYFLVFTVIVLLLYFGIHSIDFQFVKKIASIETNNNLSGKNIPQYINLYTKSIFFICLTGIVSLIFTLIIFPEKLLQKTFKKYFLFILIFFFSSYIVIFQILKFKTFHCYADLAVPLQVLHNIITGNGPISSLEESFNGCDNWFSAHFSPIIYPISAIFFLFPKVETIVVLQTLSLASTCLPLYWYANKLLKNELAGFFIAIAFLVYPPIHYGALYEFEYLKFAIPFLTFSFYFLEKEKYSLYFLFLGLSLCTREDVSLVTFALGIYIFLVQKKTKIGIVTSVVSILYFTLLILYIMPSLRGGHNVFQLGRYTHLGKSFQEVLHTLLYDPFHVIKFLFSPLRIVNFILYTLPLFFFSFFSPFIFLVALPNILTSFLTDSITNSTIFLYHLSPTIPFIFLSAINGIHNISSSFFNKKLPLNNTETVPLLISKLGRKDVIISCSFTLLITGVLSQYFFGPSPLSRQFWDKKYMLADFYTHNFHYSNYQINKHHVIVNEIITLVPNNAVITAEQPLLPHLYNRKRLYIFPDIKDDTEYILIDKKHRVKTGVGEVSDFRIRSQFYYDQIENNSQIWKLIKEKDGVYLYKKGSI